jgi:glycosyltransferase involved in cell wall biosynthesis
MFLKNTVEDLLAHIEGDTEIIVILDGSWAIEGLNMHPKVTIIYHPEVIGQRAATNEGVRISDARYVMKVDAHCSFDQGFDVKLMAEMQDDITIVPTMKNLHMFNWVCENGHTRYQSPSGVCEECGQPTTRDVVWIAKRSPNSNSFCFDPTPHFQYFSEYNKRPEGKSDLSESMSIQGSCFMMARSKYLELDICEEAYGSWGSMGIEVACKTWLSGGRVMVNHKTWYAHCFRTQGKDFGFPYHQSQEQIDHAKKYAREQFFDGQWSGAKFPLSWLVEKFWPVKGWTQKDLDDLKAANKDWKQKVIETTSLVVNTVEDVSQTVASIAHIVAIAPARALTKGVVYYTDNRIDPRIMASCQDQIKRSINGYPVTSVSLSPIPFGNNVTLPLERGYLTMFKQILIGLEVSIADVIFFAEHDVLYNPSHFQFTPPRDDVFYYNQNCWKVDAKTGHALYYDCKQTLGLCAYRDVLLRHYRERVRRVELEGFSRKMGFEPGSHNRPERVDDYKSDVWRSEIPVIDIRHSNNLTSSRWRQDQFRSQRSCRNWKEADGVPGWGVTAGRFDMFLQEINV